MKHSVGRTLKINFSKASPPLDVCQQKALQAEIIDLFGISTFDDCLEFVQGGLPFLSESFARSYSSTDENYDSLSELAFRYLDRLETSSAAQFDKILSCASRVSARKLAELERGMMQDLKREIKFAAHDLAYVVMGLDEPRSRPTPA